MINLKDLYWLAGILEGEGCFFARKGSKIKDTKRKKSKINGTHHTIFGINLYMNDEDVIRRASNIMRPHDNRYHDKAPDYRTNSMGYGFNVSGKHAIAWMMTLYPLMGNRRKQKIREIITFWKTYKVQTI